MADPILNVDPRIYGGQAPTGNAVPEFNIPGGSASGTQQPYQPPEQVPQDTLGAGSVSSAVGQMNITENSRDRATMFDAVKASAKSWSTTRVWDSINEPDFANDPNFDAKALINHTPFQLDAHEQKFLAGSNSEEQYAFRMKALQDQQALYRQMGDHPILSGIVGMADPVYLAIDLASMGVGTLATGAGAGIRTARLATAVSAAAGAVAVGKLEQRVAPVSDAEIVAMALFNGAASGMFYKAGKMHRADVTYPADDLANAAAKLKGVDTGIERRVLAEGTEAVEHVPTLMPEGGMSKAERVAKGIDDVTDTRSDALTYLTRFANDEKFGPLIRAVTDEHGEMLTKLTVQESKGLIDNGRPFYQSGDHTVFMPTSGPYATAQAALHEAMHGLTVHKLQYGIGVPGSAHGKLVGQLEELRRLAQQEVEKLDSPMKSSKYFTGNIFEFVAGLYSGNTEFSRVLANMAAPAGGNVLSKVVDAVRKLLGIEPGQMNALTKALGLTDELIKQKVKVELPANVSESARTLFGAPPAGTQAQQTETIINRMEKISAGAIGEKISWSLHKTLSQMGAAGKKVANLLVDDPINMTGDSVVSQRQAIRADLTAKQAVYEQALRDALKEEGIGTWQRFIDPQGSLQVQRDIERQVMAELDRRDNLIRRGLARTGDGAEVPARIRKLADAHGDATEAALRERKAAGELGAQAVEENRGYFNRRWSVTNIENAEEALVRSGVEEKAAKRQVKTMVAAGIARANPGMAFELAQDVASAIIERARRKGYFEDAAFRGHVGNFAAKEVRDSMAALGIPKERIDKAMEVITGVTDEAGKAANLKHRVAIDMTASMGMPDGSRLTVLDLLDHNLTRNLDQYLDNSAGNAALARKGLVTASDVDNLRTEFLKGIEGEAQRAEGAKLFDNVINHLKGNPVGEDMNNFMRKMQAVTQMVGLSSSGLWQVTEYANAMAKYGMLKTTKEILRTMPIFRELMGGLADKELASSLSNVLSRNASQDLRMRPFLAKLEDNFVLDMGDTTMLRMQEAKQWVPYINAMHYIHHNQANVVGNLVADVFQRAVKGDVKAVETVAKYGLDSHTLERIKADVLAGGADTAKWSDTTWQQIRGPLGKMMDEAVLRNRTGEIPAFAQFSSVGKFVFTFQSFVLGAHNKVLAGTLGRDGFGGLGLLMMYQFPLTYAATAANKAIKGKPETDQNKLVLHALAQMGSLGLVSELFGIASGDKQQFGTPGLMAVDKLYKISSSFAKGNMGDTNSAVVNALPIISIIPGVKAFAETLKDDKKQKHN